MRFVGMRLSEIMVCTLVLASGCAAHTHYPVDKMAAGDAVVGLTLSGEHESVIPTGSLSGRLGIKDVGDAGILLGWDGLTTKSGSFGLGGLAVGGSYRGYVPNLDWLRVALDVTFHHADQAAESFFYGAEDLELTHYVVDDWFDSQLIVEFAWVTEWFGLHAGPVLKTGVWIPDGARESVAPANASSPGVSFLGLAAGGFFGLAVAPKKSVSFQLDGQIVPLAAGFEPPDDATSNPLGLGTIELALSLFVRF